MAKLANNFKTTFGKRRKGKGKKRVGKRDRKVSEYRGQGK